MTCFCYGISKNSHSNAVNLWSRVWTVSYTHLDVYKRQAGYCTLDIAFNGNVKNLEIEINRVNSEDLSLIHISKVSLTTLIDIANALDTTFDALICDNLEKGKVVFDEEISQELEECSEEDIRIVYDMVKALVKSLAKRKH